MTLLRLVHPFPSLLDGLVTTILALVVGGSVPTAVRLGLSMVALQAAIGALNDLVDAPTDAISKPRKPIPAGLVAPTVARLVVVVGVAAGLLLAALSGLPTVVVGLLILASGFSYDLAFKGTALSWLPFALGLPLLPVFAVVGATGMLPGWLAVLVPIAALAGAGLAMSNGLADAERDASAGVRSVAVALGPRRAWAVHLAVLGTALALALVSLLVLGGSAVAVIATLGGGLVVLAGAGLASAASAGRRERGWELEAIGVGLVGAAWVAGATAVV